MFTVSLAFTFMDKLSNLNWSKLSRWIDYIMKEINLSTGHIQIAKFYTHFMWSKIKYTHISTYTYIFTYTILRKPCILLQCFTMYNVFHVGIIEFEFGISKNVFLESNYCNCAYTSWQEQVQHHTLNKQFILYKLKKWDILWCHLWNVVINKKTTTGWLVICLLVT